MNPQAWYSLIRLTPNLQWAYLDIFFLSHHDAYAHRPSDHTLPFLSTLTAFCNNFGEGFDAHEILFMNLHLPALRDLSLYIEVDTPLELARIHTRINGSLKGLPSVITLTLGLQLYACRISELNTLWRQDTGIEKLVHCTPNVTHLVLEMWPDPSCRDIEQETLPMLHYWTNMLRPGRWLDLKNPGAISKVTVVVRKSWVTVLLPLAKDSFGKLLGLDKENENDECSVVLEVVEEGKWEFGPHSKQWESWGMSL
ncbi:hypothetical protein BDN70DRAFT_871127 [Pholiota conissans]|uniref:Uncharacterized protein n=1 Tax=Pholiota conissans TaxID=109636 RepID=A0A9P5ZD28_9AGAR|nr:hypothetical protein BDN70DRAFT_871127 [Pholiota conissans]